MTVSGALRFARFAVPPNELGYCGPEDPSELAAYRAGEIAPDNGLVELAHGFEGAWPYLELLAGAAQQSDPLAEPVVDAYWIGNELCSRVSDNDWGWHLLDRFGPRAGRDSARLTEGVGGGAIPHHSFHVFCVYPWVGLLREGRGGHEPLNVLRQCHISWGVVLGRADDQLLIWGPMLGWIDGRLSLGPATQRSVWLDPRLSSLDRRIAVGAAVAVHWGQVVDVLDTQQLRWLMNITRSQIAVANQAAVAESAVVR